MNCLPEHGRVPCNCCFQTTNLEFDQDVRNSDDGSWRIVWNPLAWGNRDAEIVALGFSKGPTQRGALAREPHDQIAFKRARTKVGRIFEYLGVAQRGENENYRSMVDRLISDRNGRFHFGSLVRCTVERYDCGKVKWMGTGGGMLDKFVSSSFGKEIGLNCTSQFLSKLPPRTKLVILFGLGTAGNYIIEARKLIEQARPGRYETINDVAYTDGSVTFVHVEHFTVQGAHLQNWLGINDHPRSRFGYLAHQAVQAAVHRSPNA